MGPMQLHERIQRERARIDGKLQASSKTPGDYAEAYGECKELLLWTSIEVARLDPAFGIAPQAQMSYDDVIAREA